MEWGGGVFYSASPSFHRLKATETIGFSEFHGGDMCFAHEKFLLPEEDYFL